ncbi:MAG: Gfo/Idh/MocA family oxidoreductase [Phycisphaerae bacterium]|jgi:predicted dehydrogenase
MAGKIRWGILGTGSIAGKFAEGLSLAQGAELLAVGSRTQATADAFADRFGIPRRHATYEALAADNQVDIVYVSTPHPFHKANTLLCLEAGKAVLCEKPFAMSAAQAREMVALARRKKLFLMEAMWMRFLPAMVKVRELIAAGRIGAVQMISADFGFRGPWNPQSRLLNAELGGGSLLDVGVYPISLASMILGRFSRVMGLSRIGSTGVDEQAAIVLGNDQGQLASLTCAVRTASPHEACIMGEEGMIRLPGAWWHGTTLTVSSADRNAPAERMDLPYPGNGLCCEAVEVMKCLAAGAAECPVMPLDESVTIMETMDQLREQWGLKYPIEG